MKKISIGTGAFLRGPYASRPVPFDACLERLQALGFDGLELSARSPHPSPSTLDTPEKRAALKQKLADAGLTISGLSIDFQGQYPFQDDPEGYVKVFGDNLQFAANLGIHNLRVDTNIAPERLARADEKAAVGRAIDTWKRCARLAAERGVRVVWEFEPCFAFNKPSQILEVVRGVDEPNFGVLFDTCHARTVAGVGARQTGEREVLERGEFELLEMLEGWIGAIHVIDTDGTLHDGETSAHLPFGAGTLDFDRLVPALLRSGTPNDWWCIDLCFCPTAWEAAGDCKKALDSYLARYDHESPTIA
jgi:sugar phosphate isomerase/epimerase